MTESNQQQNQQSEQQPHIHQTIIVQEKKSNSVGTAGFVLALLGLFLFWIPIIGWILWLLGAILSTVGLFKKPRGLAVTGFVISFFFLIITIIFGAFFGLATLTSLVPSITPLF